jgi:hypothetical protein
MTGAMEHWKTHTAILEDEYEYTSFDETCKESDLEEKSGSPVNSIHGWHFVEFDEFGDNLKSALNEAPVSVGLDAKSVNF